MPACVPFPWLLVPVSLWCRGHPATPERCVLARGSQWRRQQQEGPGPSAGPPPRTGNENWHGDRRHCHFSWARMSQPACRWLSEPLTCIPTQVRGIAFPHLRVSAES